MDIRDEWQRWWNSVPPADSVDETLLVYPLVISERAATPLVHTYMGTGYLDFDGYQSLGRSLKELEGVVSELGSPHREYYAELCKFIRHVLQEWVRR